MATTVTFMYQMTYVCRKNLGVLVVQYNPSSEPAPQQLMWGDDLYERSPTHNVR